MKKTFILCLLITLTTGCVATMPPPQKTQLEIREYQTRIYETNNTGMAMKVVLDVLQDRGYTVKNAVMELGLIVAEKQVFIENKGEAFAATFWAGAAGRWKVSSIVESTVNVSLASQSTCRIRASFVQKITDNRNVPMYINTNLSENGYQEFFVWLDKGLFLQSELLNVPIPGLKPAVSEPLKGKLSEWESGIFDVEKVAQEKRKVDSQTGL